MSIKKRNCNHEDKKSQRSLFVTININTGKLDKPKNDDLLYIGVVAIKNEREQWRE